VNDKINDDEQKNEARQPVLEINEGSDGDN
jgi:hypothetical protein